MNLHVHNAIDEARLAKLLSDRLSVGEVTLERLRVKSAWPVYRASAARIAPVFVKVTESAAANRALDFLRRVDRCSLFPKVVFDGQLVFDELSVLCLEWKDARMVNAEDMNDAQLNSFVDGCGMLSCELRKAKMFTPIVQSDDMPETQYAMLSSYLHAHPLAGRLMRGLLDLPVAERTYGELKLAVIHGDFQPKNYGFDGNRFVAVFDTDDLTEGLPCEDAAYAFTERARRSELGDVARSRLESLFAKFVSRSSWPIREWRIAINHARLRIAARRLAHHSSSPFIAIDIARRDRPLQRLLKVLG